jgi:hypothetical protein
MEKWELEAREKEVLDLEQTALFIAQKRQMQTEQAATIEGMRDAQKELGLSDQEMTQMLWSDPQARLETVRKSAAVFARSLATKPRGPDGKFLSKGAAAAQGKDTSSTEDRGKRIEQITADRKAGKLSSDRSLNALIEQIMPSSDPIWKTR